MKYFKLFFLFFICSNTCLQSEELNEEFFRKVVPFFEELYTESGDPFVNIQKKFGLQDLDIKEIKRSKISYARSASFKVKEMEIKVAVQRKPENYQILEIDYVFFFPKWKKRKEIKVKNDIFAPKSFFSNNFAYEFGLHYREPENAKPKWDYVYSGRRIEANLKEQSLTIACRHTGLREFSMDCGDEYDYTRRFGDVVRKSSTICKNQCFEILPWMSLGKYQVRRDSTLVRSEPSRSGKILDKLNRDLLVDVIEDTGVHEEINEDIAPWVKIKYNDSNFGYVYGGLLRRVGEYRP